jgi:hypothetical protein
MTPEQFGELVADLLRARQKRAAIIIKHSTTHGGQLYIPSKLLVSNRQYVAADKKVKRIAALLAA